MDGVGRIGRHQFQPTQIVRGRAQCLPHQPIALGWVTMDHHRMPLYPGARVK